MNNSSTSLNHIFYVSYIQRVITITEQSKLHLQLECHKYVSSADCQKGINAVKQCSVENQKGTIGKYFVQR